MLRETEALLAHMMHCHYGADLPLANYHGDFLGTLPAEAFIDHGVASEPELTQDILEQLRHVLNPSAGQRQHEVERNDPKNESNTIVDTPPRQ